VVPSLNTLFQRRMGTCTRRLEVIDVVVDKVDLATTAELEVEGSSGTVAFR